MNNWKKQDNSMKTKLLHTIQKFGDKLISLQLNEERFGDAQGGFFCPACQLVHRRCGDAIFPLYLLFGTTGNTDYRDAACRLLAYLERNQSENGSWYNEFASDWNGTTVFQLLSLCHAHLYLQSIGESEEATQLVRPIERSARFVSDWMGSGKVRTNVNYFITSALVLLLSGRIAEEPIYEQQAEQLMEKHGMANLDAEGFLHGETTGDRWDRKAGRVDIGYNLDMSLGAMAEYALLTGNERVKNEALRALDAHLAFFYPDGSMDNSFGSRSYKWTLYGSKTAHGCQMALLLLADQNPAYARAAELNLEYLLRACGSAGEPPGNGPHHEAVFGGGSRCMHPVINRADALSVAFVWGRDTNEREKLPTEKLFGLREYPSLQVRHVRTAHWMATVSCSQVKHAPTGGSISYLWAKGRGPIQIGAATTYLRHEAINMPRLPADALTTTPHIEAESEGLSYSSLYEHDPNWTDSSSFVKDCVRFGVEGRLKRLSGGEAIEGPIAYQIDYSFDGPCLVKQYRLIVRRESAFLCIVEPIVALPEEVIVRTSLTSATVISNKGSLTIEWEGSGIFVEKPFQRVETAVAAFPAVTAKPFEWTAAKVPAGEYEWTVRFILQPRKPRDSSFVFDRH